MKKVLAVVLSLIMLFAVCVPAFAVHTITDKTEGSTADSKLSTSMQKEDGTDGASYVVTIPAETVIPWEKTKTLFNYSVKTQLESGKRLSVTVVSDCGRNVLTDAAKENEIPYTFSRTNGGDHIETLAYTTDKEVIDTNRTFNIDIATAAWEAVPVNVYTCSLVFTVEVVDA